MLTFDHKYEGANRRGSTGRRGRKGRRLAASRRAASAVREQAAAATPPDDKTPSSASPGLSRSRSPTFLAKLLRVGLLVLLAFLLAGAGIALGFVRQAIKDLPAVGDLGPRPAVSSTIYDSRGKIVTRIHGDENRIPVDIDDLPKHLLDAVVAIEDDRFYHHPGFDLKAIARAAYVNLTRKKTLQGGSTITQQLVRNAILKNPQRTYARKVQEILLAMQLERRYTKKEILEMYLNQVPFGFSAYGVEAASQMYFGKRASQLDLAESALLAGLIQAPSAYSPYNNMEAAKARQAMVLDKMASLGMISKEDAEKAKAQPLKIKPRSKPGPNTGSDFLDYVLAQLLDRFGPDLVYGGGLKIYTTLDPAIQAAAEAAVKKVLDPVFPLGKGKDQPDAAVVVMQPQTGYVKALVGGREHKGQLEFNNAVHALRQPGSAFKPVVVYAAALDNGYSPGTVLDDAPVFFPAPRGGQAYSPENYDRTFRGLVTLREAVEQSLNVPAVKVFNKIGIQTGIEYAMKLGIKSLVTDAALPRNDLHLPTAVGGITRGVSPLEMAVAYSTFANGGIRVEPVSILKVTDQNGVTLWENRPAKTMVLKPQTAFLMNDILKGVISRGTGSRANIGRPAAGKTGTTDDYADAWFCGYTPELTCIVWMGYSDQRRPMPGKIVGGSYPAEIWKMVMSQATRDLPRSDFPRPGDIVDVDICGKSGKLPGEHCPPECIRREIFVRGTEPVETCGVHVAVDVCAETGKLPGPYCPRVEKRVFIRRPEPCTPTPDGRVPRDANLEAPTEVCPLHLAPQLPPGAGESPGPNGWQNLWDRLRKHLPPPAGKSDAREEEPGSRETQTSQPGELPDSAPPSSTTVTPSPPSPGPPNR